MAANTITTVSQVTRSVTISTDVDYVITGSTPFSGSNASINITNTNHAVVILKAIKPSATISNWLRYVKINGVAASNGNNCQVKMYGRGTIILPYSQSLTPLTCYTGQNYTGTACTDYSTGSDGGFMKTLSDATLLNTIRSFKLKRGYMVTFATGTSGWGYSRCFIADKEDLEMAVLPAVFDRKISSYRLFRWNDAQKKGLAADPTAATNSALNSAWCYTWGVGNDMSPDVECVPHKIHKNWPGVGDCGSAEFSPHMKTDNEPANSSDDTPGTVSEILGYWQDAMRTGMRLCSPSSHDGGYDWQKEFMKAIDERGWRCDILDMHCYWAAGSFSSLQDYYNKYKRPIWVSELLWGASWSSTGIFAETSDWDSNSTSNQNANYNGAKPVLDALNGYPYVERYAWWNGDRNCSKVYCNSALTTLGKYYAEMDCGIGFSHNYEFIPVVVIKAPYHLTVLPGDTGNTVTLNWSDANGDMMDQIQVQYKRPGETEWTSLALIDRQEKTSSADQNYTYTVQLDEADTFSYRIVNILDGAEYPSHFFSLSPEIDDDLALLPANMGDYYFQFYSKEATTDLCWSVGNGSNTTDVYYQTPKTAGTDLSQLWILEENSYGGYSLRNLSTPGYLMCSPNAWNFITNKSDYIDPAEKANYLPEYHRDGNFWTMKNVGHDMYVGLWDQDKNFAVGERLAGNRTNATSGNDSGDKIGIRAIPRTLVNDLIAGSDDFSWTLGQTYHLYNVDAGQFLTNGNAWGTQASLANEGMRWTVELKADKYRLKNSVTDNPYLYATNAGELWVDGDGSKDCDYAMTHDAATGRTRISLSSSSSFIPSSIISYVGWNGDKGSSVVNPCLGIDDHCTPGTDWLFMDALAYAMYKGTVVCAQPVRRNMWPYVKAAKVNGLATDEVVVYENPASTILELNNAFITLKATLLAAITSAIPTGDDEAPIDVSFLLTNADCSSASFDGWIRQGEWGSNTTFYRNDNALLSNRFYEIWTSSEGSLTDRRLSQTLSNLPAGKYRLAVDIVASRQNDASLQVEGVTLFLGDEHVTCASANGLPETFVTPVLSVDNGESVTFGIDVNATNANWVAFDNFRLLYTASTLLGDVNRDGVITIADVTALVNIVLGKDTAGQYNRDAADVNQDNSITIADVTALVNILLRLFDEND